MSLFSSIQMANNSLRATQVGLQVVGQNISNANTPGYIREEVILSPAPTQRVGSLLLGMGVQVEGIVQKIDSFLSERIRTAESDRTDAEVRKDAYLQLEGLIGELTDTDLSTTINNFFSSIAGVLDQPESVAVRSLAIQKGEILTGDINRLARRVRQLRTDMNKRVTNAATDINRLTGEIFELNKRITSIEGGNSGASEAVGLRDQRLLALDELSRLIDIRVEEQSSGGVTVFTGGDFLVLDAQRREVEVVQSTDRGLSIGEIYIKETQSPLEVQGGEVAGLYAARDEILGGFLDNLDNFTSTLAFEFNRVYSSGQGLTGFNEIESEFSVTSTSLALDEAGLPFTPGNGQFEIKVLNPDTGSTKTTIIRVDLNGLDNDTTMASLTAAIDAVGGITATTTPTGQLVIRSDSPDLQISFANDSSGLLAALGINTFFSGSSALDLGVSQAVADDPSKFAASQNGIGADTETAIELTAFLDRAIGVGDDTIGVIYNQLVSEVTQGSTVTQSVADGLDLFSQTLQSQQQAITGVSLDEEAVRMITLQRTYQATARYIRTISELLDVLVSL